MHHQFASWESLASATGEPFAAAVVVVAVMERTCAIWWESWVHWIPRWHSSSWDPSSWMWTVVSMAAVAHDDDGDGGDGDGVEGNEMQTMAWSVSAVDASSWYPMEHDGGKDKAMEYGSWVMTVWEITPRMMTVMA